MNDCESIGNECDILAYLLQDRSAMSLDMHELLDRVIQLHRSPCTAPKMRFIAALMELVIPCSAKDWG